MGRCAGNVSGGLAAIGGSQGLDTPCGAHFGQYRTGNHKWSSGHRNGINTWWLRRRLGFARIYRTRCGHRTRECPCQRIGRIWLDGHSSCHGQPRFAGVHGSGSR